MSWFIEYGNQLAIIDKPDKPAKKFGTNGYYILPAPNGLGDGYGMYVWVDEHFVTSHRLENPFEWYDLPGGVQARWIETGHGNDYIVIREVRKKPNGEADKRVPDCVCQCQTGECPECSGNISTNGL